MWKYMLESMYRMSVNMSVWMPEQESEDLPERMSDIARIYSRESLSWQGSLEETIF